MDSLVVVLDERLSEIGDTIGHTVHLDVDSYALGTRSFRVPSGIDVDVVLTNAGEGILVTGIVRATLVGTCDRCLDEARLQVAGELDEYFLFEGASQGQDMDDDLDGPEFSLVGADSTIDLTDACASAFGMEVPYVVLCRPECRGLCPVCGENLNHVDCGHAGELASRAERERIESSPFAVLKDLRLDS